MFPISRGQGIVPPLDLKVIDGQKKPQKILDTNSGFFGERSRGAFFFGSLNDKITFVLLGEGGVPSLRTMK
jgi:hypothetical protein